MNLRRYSRILFIQRIILTAITLLTAAGCSLEQTEKPTTDPPAPPGAPAASSISADSTAKSSHQPGEQDLLAQARRYEELRKPQTPQQPEVIFSNPAPNQIPKPPQAPPNAAVQPPSTVTIQPAVNTTQTALVKTQHPATHTAAQQSDRPLTREQISEKLTGLLNANMSGSGAVKPYLQRAAMSVIDPRLELGESDLTGLTYSDQQLVLHYQRLFIRLGRELGANTKEDRQLLMDAADTLANRVSREKPLAITNIRMCTKVDGYGVYQEMADRKFLVGQVHPVVVYAELEHFTSKPNENGQHIVKLQQELVLYNQADGLAVWRQAPVTVVDTSRNKRRDFFVAQIIQLSKRLTVGKYRLKLSITDVNGQQVDEATLPIEIVADQKLVE